MLLRYISYKLEDMATMDPGWEHGVAQGGNKKKVKCNYCGKVVSGGIYRLKQHLARISGQVTYCKKAPEEVYLKMKENMYGYRAGRKRQHEEEKHSFGYHFNDDYEEHEEPVGNKRKRSRCQKSDGSLVVSMASHQSLGFVDPGWEHGVAQDDTKKKVKCNYCGKTISGGINRFKQHLARIPGEVAACKRVPEDVYLDMKENMKWHRTGSRLRLEARELASFYNQSENDEEEFARDRIKLNRFIGGKDVSCSVKNEQSKQKVIDKRGHKEITSAIFTFFNYAAIPFNAANSPYFQKMLDVVSQYGQGFKAPSNKLVSGLDDEVLSIRENLAEIKASFKATGCTIMADTWKDMQERTRINFLVSCPRGTYFISTIDATDIVEEVTNLFTVLDKVVEEVGEENVVQVITENTPCYKAAGKMLEEKRKSLFWTPCAAYCIEKLLEDFTKIKWVRECIQKGQKITRLIYNCASLLNLMLKEFTAGRELLKPAPSKISTSFITLQSLLVHKAALRKMFQSRKWRSSRLAKSVEGKEVEKIVLSSLFWKRMQFVNKSVHPIVNVLKKVHSDEGLPMPSIYNDMYRAKHDIKAIHGDDEQKYGSFWSVIDNWISNFHHPLYVAAYYLNPACRYRSDFMAIPEVIRGLNECITRLELDNGRRVSAATQISEFDFAKADFGTELALATRKELQPATWWQQHGISCLELQRIAIRILSQTYSSIGCEHTWSSFDQLYSARKNHLAQKKLNDITYVHYNLRLQEKQLKRSIDDSVSLDNALVERQFHDWVIDTQKTALQEDTEILYIEMEQTDNDNAVNEIEDLDRDPKKALTDSLLLLRTVEHLSTANAASDEDDTDLGFLEDGISD